SCDISGIQDYIYTISGTKALRSLRARSLYLELLLENILDDLLYRLNLSRCNLLYTGGGHGYLLLPNTDQTKDIIEDFEKELKSWFLKEFNISLYIASGYTHCNSEELSKNIGQVYERVGKKVAVKKTQRYTTDDILFLNTMVRQQEDRECIECNRTGSINEEKRCRICQALIEISPEVTREDTYFVVSGISEENLPRATLPLPFNRALGIKTKQEALKDNYIRIYSKNQPSVGLDLATNLWVGDYSVRSNNKYGTKDFEELAHEAQGIKRIAVLRADVDNLGQAFISGFKSKDAHYETISRTSTLSRQLSMFFKFYVNHVLKDKNRNAIIIYSGGDDMFIVGSWNEVIDLAGEINAAFNKYTQGTLTISAGIGIYNHSYPISRIALEAGELENAAKTKDEKKNKVTLFRKAKLDERGNAVEEDWILGWERLPMLDSVDTNGLEHPTPVSGIEDKLLTLRKVFRRDSEHGKAFLYKILELLRQSNKDSINIARYAYLLQRAQEKNPSLDVTKFYQYIKDPRERKELEIAVTLYSYETRK
ncbi:MAG: type III-A CRISPR-associated protein Cas10/Csm1, partial [Clostridia bacterium]|nr:type III-A CRISPR-associated protein Cas10/Csm1 [Clostridia bacterium]